MMAAATKAAKSSADNASAFAVGMRRHVLLMGWSPPLATASARPSPLRRPPRRRETEPTVSAPSPPRWCPRSSIKDAPKLVEEFLDHGEWRSRERRRAGPNAVAETIVDGSAR